MQCVSPIRIRGDDGVVRFVPCGRCYACLSRKRQSWALRNQVELKYASSATFVTLTYDDDHLKFGSGNKATLCKRDFQLFMKRLRKSCEPAQLRFFACGEYGTKSFRPHYHMLLYNYPLDKDIDKLIQNAWPYATCKPYFGTLTPRSINYVCKYTLKQQGLYKDMGVEPPFMLCSRRPAIGYQITEKGWFDIQLFKKGYLTLEDGVKVSIPRYYQDKILKPYPDRFKESIKTARNLQFQKHADELYKRKVRKYGENLVSKKIFEGQLANERQFGYILNKDNTI